MDKSIDELKKQLNEAKDKAFSATNNVALNKGKISDIIKREEQLIEIAHNTPLILDHYDNQFEKITKLDKRDMPFLFFAVALHTARQTFQPKMHLDKAFETISRDKRHSSQDDGNKEKKEAKEKADNLNNYKKSSKDYPDAKNILLYPVPYDAMKGTERIVIPGVSESGKQLYSGNHHSATMGHDPILGYVFGVSNILTRTISFKNPTLQTCFVELDERAKFNPGKYAGQTVTYDMTHSDFVNSVVSTCKEDINRLPAAIAKQTLHIQSDKYCKIGLPIPFINADIAQDLLKLDWNSYELERFNSFVRSAVFDPASQQVAFSCFVNVVIEMLHKLCYLESKGISKSLYSVKTHRILVWSNAIASFSNIIKTKVTLNPNNADLGGFCTTLSRLAFDEEIISAIKKEFVFESYYEKISNV